MNAWDRLQLATTWPHTTPTYRLQLTQAPEDQPLSFEDAALHLRLGDPAGAEAVMQQPLVERMIAAAVGEVQRYCDAAIMTQKWKLTTPWLPTPAYLPKAPLQSVDSIKDPAGATVDPTTYRVTIDERMPGAIMPVSGMWPFSPPPIYGGGGYWGSVPHSPPVEIEFTAGRDDAADVPAELIQAMLLMIGTWFMHRESAQPFTLSVIPEHAGVTALLDPFRVEVLV
jgi:hypothetical protein